MITLAVIERDFNISFKDTGKSNTLSNRGFLSCMEDIGGYHSDLVGFGINDISKTRLSWILLGWKVHIIERPAYGHPIHFKTWARHTEKFYTYRDFEAYDYTGKLIAVATSKWVLVNIDTGKITRLTDDLVNRYDPEMKTVFSEIEMKKLKEPASYSYTYLYKVLRMNIDINKHMHNLYYLDVAYEALPEEVYDTNDFMNFEIMYKHEVKLGETLKCLYSKKPDGHYVVIKSEDEKVLHAIIKLY